MIRFYINSVNCIYAFNSRMLLVDLINCCRLLVALIHFNCWLLHLINILYYLFRRSTAWTYWPVSRMQLNISTASTNQRIFTYRTPAWPSTPSPRHSYSLSVTAGLFLKEFYRTIIISYHIISHTLNGRTTSKLKQLKVKIQSVSDDDVRRRLLWAGGRRKVYSDN